MLLFESYKDSQVVKIMVVTTGYWLKQGDGLDLKQASIPVAGLLGYGFNDK